MSEWKKVRLGEVCNIFAGGDAPDDTSPIRTNTLYVPVYSNGISRKGLYGYTSKSRVKQEAITISARGTIGAVFFRNEPFFPIVRLITVIPQSSGLDTKFLYYRLLLVPFAGDGSAVKQLTVPMISEYEIDFPSLPTQRKIAAVLSSLDDKIENNRKICANLEAQAQAIFKNSDRRSDAVPFTALIKILSGGTPKTSEPSYWGGDIPFFSPKDVGEPYAIYTERTITKDGLDSCNSGFYPKDTTFVTARGTVGKVCLAGVPMAMNQSCFALASDIIDSLLVYYYTKASIDSLKSKANGSVFDAITIAEFETERIARLKESEERKFVNIVRPMFDKILSLSIESRALAATRDALLPKLMSGEIDVETVEMA